MQSNDVNVSTVHKDDRTSAGRCARDRSRSTMCLMFEEGRERITVVLAIDGLSAT